MTADRRDGGFLLLLGTHWFLRERAVAAALRCYSGPVVGVSTTGKLGRNRYFDEVLAANPFSVDEVMEAVDAYVRRLGRTPDGVVPLVDWALPAACAVARAFGLPSLSAASIERCRNKAEMKRVLSAHGIPTPAHREFRSLSELYEVAPALGYPLVIKPRDFGGSGGVIKVQSESDIPSAFEHCQATLNENAPSFCIAADAFQAEEYVAADQEVSVEVLVVRGEPRVLAVTDKYLGPEPWFAEMGHVVPSIHRDDPTVAGLAREACRALEIEIGMAHVEMRLPENGPVKLMEVGARPAGGGIMDLVERAYGVSPYELHIAAWLGREPPATTDLRPLGTAAVAFLKAPVGRIASVRPPSAIPDAVVGLLVTGAPGDLSEPPNSWRSREGVLELFWPGPPRRLRTDEHIRLAASLSESIFTITPPFNGDIESIAITGTP
jgi:biotin carboxylase